MKLYYFLLLFFIIPFLIEDSFAQSIEHGQNFDRELLSINPDGTITYKWTSQPDRVWDGTKWANYILSETDQYIRFESQKISFEFYKNTCDFKIYEAGLIGLKSPSIDSYSHSLTIDGISQILPKCTLSAITTDSNGIHFSATRDLFKTVYDLSFKEGLEWTHEIDNFAGKDVTILVTDVCSDCIADDFDGNLIKFGNYTLDTKNEVHNTIKELKQEKNFIIEYEDTVRNGEKLIIDPTFIYTSGTKYTPRTQNGSGASCPSVGVTPLSSTHWIYIADSSSSSRCWRQSAEWPIATIPDTAEVDSIKLRLTTSGTTNMGTESCEFNSIESQPSTLSTSDLWDDIGDGTTFSTGDTDCRTDQTYEKTLSASAISDLETNLSGAENWWGIGIKLTDETRDGSDHGIKFDNIELEVVYDKGEWNAGPPINLAVTSNLVNQINFTWTPDNATGVSGYSIWNNSANSANDWEWDWLANTANFTETDDSGFYLHDNLSNCKDMYYKVAAMSINNGTNATSSKGSTFCINIIELTQSITNVGDMFKVSGTVSVGSVNLTSITLSENGTITDTNSTGQNTTTNTSIHYTFWERDVIGGPRNITVTVHGQNPSWESISNETKSYPTREYSPDYKTAIDDTQGLYNFTETRNSNGGTSNLKVNRINTPTGETWPLECNYKDELFESGTWYNTSINQGFIDLSASVTPTRNAYVTCYNDPIVFTFTSFGNKNATLAIVDFSDQLGTFAGVPLPFLFIVFLAAIFTGRSAVTGIIFLAITIGTMGIMGFLPDVNGDPAISGIVWSMIVFLTAIGVFVGKKFF